MRPSEEIPGPEGVRKPLQGLLRQFDGLAVFLLSEQGVKLRELALQQSLIMKWRREPNQDAVRKLLGASLFTEPAHMRFAGLPSACKSDRLTKPFLYAFRNVSMNPPAQSSLVADIASPEEDLFAPHGKAVFDAAASPGEQALQVLKTIYGYDQFRGRQAEVIDSLLNGRSTLAVMPTGMGKSICFQIPAMIFGGLTLVVSPLVALMEDQVMALKLAGIAADTINSSRSRESNVAVWRQVAAGEISLLYIAPERLMTERMLAALAKLPVRLIAIDEAHCISRWGPSFRPDYEGLTRLTDFFPQAPIAALTATADHATREDIADKLFPRASDGTRQGSVIVSGFDRPNIRLSVTLRKDWKKQLLDFVEARRDQSGIVYCLSRRKTEEVPSFSRITTSRPLPIMLAWSRIFALRIRRFSCGRAEP